MTEQKRGRDQGESDLPAKLGAPARRALERAGYTRLEHLAGAGETELLRLHGMRPKAIIRLQAALKAAGLEPLRGVDRA